MHRLAVGTFDDDAAIAGIDLDVVCGDVVDAVAVFVVLVCELSPVAVGQISIEASAGDNDAVDTTHCGKRAFAHDGGRHRVGEHKAINVGLVEYPIAQGVDRTVETHIPQVVITRTECSFANLTQCGGEIER